MNCKRSLLALLAIATSSCVTVINSNTDLNQSLDSSAKIREYDVSSCGFLHLTTPDMNDLEGQLLKIAYGRQLIATRAEAREYLGLVQCYHLYGAYKAGVGEP